MTARAAAVAELIRTALAAADQLDPVERESIYKALFADLRARRPEAVSPMTLGPPTEPIRDPRSGGRR
ncbi:MAG TPA: hypothetical protein VFU97_15785 [Xanthobacteraceae bacterium]|nr:hypothetical protein [Xanthobacteraceae bacterium]